MSKGAIIGVVFLVMMSSAAGAAFVLMGGEETTPTGPGPAGPAPPPPAKYAKFPNYDFTGGDIGCESGVEAAACEIKCDNDANCMSYIHTANDKLCCLKHSVPNITNLPDRQITGFIKNVTGYEVKDKGDRIAGDIQSFSGLTIAQCGEKCKTFTDCVGFSANNGRCIPKRAAGLDPNHQSNGWQFYTKK